MIRMLGDDGPDHRTAIATKVAEIEREKRLLRGWGKNRIAEIILSTAKVRLMDQVTNLNGLVKWFEDNCGDGTDEDLVD